MAKKRNVPNNGTEKKDRSVSKTEKIEVDGVVTEILKGSDYLIELENGHTVKAYVSGKMRMHNIRILPGDKVTVELSPYDLTRGIIKWNNR